MTLFSVAFLAGVLTVLAPCVLSLLPIIIGGSLAEKKPLRPLIVVGSLSFSVIVFTLLLKGTTALIGLPQEVLTFLSGGLIIFFGFTMLFPRHWARTATALRFHKSEEMLAESGKLKGNAGAVLLGASLGPVFSTCSPTYSLILAVVLPQSFGLALLYISVYSVGMAVPLFAIGYGGQKIAAKFRWSADPHGKLKRFLGIILILTGVAIITKFDKQVETFLVERGYAGAQTTERLLLERIKND